MPDYEKMYHTLFHEACRTIEALQTALQACEEIYMETCDAESDAANTLDEPPFPMVD